MLKRNTDPSAVANKTPRNVKEIELSTNSANPPRIRSGEYFQTKDKLRLGISLSGVQEVQQCFQKS